LREENDAYNRSNGRIDNVEPYKEKKVAHENI